MCLDLCPCSEPQFKKAIHVCSLKSAARESNVIPQKAKFQLDIIVVTHLQVAVTATYKHFYKRWLTRTQHAYALWLSGCTLPCMYLCLSKKSSTTSFGNILRRAAMLSAVYSHSNSVCLSVCASVHHTRIKMNERKTMPSSLSGLQFLAL